jgi:uncharacterized integral membrane protein
MVLRLGEAVGVSLRERNQLPVAAGLPPAYPEAPWPGRSWRRTRPRSIYLLSAHHPYPAMVVWSPTAAQTIVNWPEVAWAGLTRLRQELDEALSPLDLEHQRGVHDQLVGSPSPKDSQPGQEPYPGDRLTRLSWAWTALVTGIVALVLILVFILQNLQSVDLSFLVFHGHLPLAVALLFAVILGAVIVAALGGARIRQLRVLARRGRRQGVPSRPPAE